MNQQEMEVQIANLKRVSNFWNYFEAILGVVLLIVSVCMLLTTGSSSSLFGVLCGGLLIVYAETKRLHNIMMWHSSQLWEYNVHILNNLADINELLDGIQVRNISDLMSDIEDEQ